MVAEHTDDPDQEQLAEELRFLENQYARADRKAAFWTRRRLMLLDAVQRKKQEMGIEP